VGLITRIRVLQIQLRYNVNASDLAEQLIMGLPDSDYEVTTVFLRGKPGPGEPESKAAHSVYFDCKPQDLKGIRRWLVLMRLYRFCKEQGFDVVIAHRFKPISMMMWISRWLANTVFIGVQHGIGDYDRSSRRLEAGLLITSRWRMVGVSYAVAGYLKRTVPAFNDENTIAINNAIDIDRARALMLSAEDARDYFGLPQRGRIIGSIGRLVPVKGHAVLIRAFHRIVEKYPDVSLAIIGEGRERAALETLIARLGLERKVILLGAHNDALRYVRAFDIFAMPSFSEGLPLALLEALAGERPVVGSDIPSMEPILSGCGGRIFVSGNEVDLSAKLSALLDLSLEELRENGAAGYRYLCENHAIGDFRENYRKLINSMLNKRKSQ
jgi:glycosyltransferase involved in cell wall biosynthesis